jgi:prepilin-type N-terminal cleavage/methylation domain-containing protein
MMKHQPAMNYSRISGFTLVEIISVLVIVGFLSTVALPDFFNIQERIRLKMVDNVVKDLNRREYMIWSTHSASSGGYDDEGIFNSVNPENLGPKFTWSSGPNPTGISTITFGPTVVDLRRTPSSSDDSGYWTRVTSTHYTISLDDGLRFGTSGWSSSFLNGSYAGSSPNILIPASMDGVTLIRVWQDVFNTIPPAPSGQPPTPPYEGATLTSVAFDAGSQIDRIHARAFANNTITTIELPPNLNRIDTGAFMNNQITEIVLPNSLTTIEGRAFLGNDLTKITIGSGVIFHGDIHNNALGNNTLAFKEAYAASGEGTYTWNGSTWVKE